MKYLYSLLIFCFLGPRLHAQEAILDKFIYKETIINCSLDTAWWKWTTSAGLKTFFGPDNRIDLRPGGAYEIYFTADTSVQQRGGEGCKVLSYLPKKMLSFTWNAPPNQTYIRNHPHKTWLVLAFEAISPFRTKIKLHHFGWLEGPEWEETYRYFDKAWGLVLQWLAQSCKATPPRSELDIFTPLLHKTWVVDTTWASGQQFKQETSLEFILDEQLLISRSKGFINQDQTEYGSRNFGIRYLDTLTQTIRIYEFDVFGGLTEGIAYGIGKDIYFQYTYKESAAILGLK